MRSLFGIFLLIVTLVFPLGAQESKKGFEVNFSLVHPAKWSLNPALEVLYFTSLSNKFWVAGGLFAQAGKHNWLELTGHAFYDDFGIPYRVRTDYSRQLEFFSLGIPVKVGLECNNVVFNSVFLGFAAGKHLKLEMADYLHSEFVYNEPVSDYYKSVFWELSIGIRKQLFLNGNFSLSLSPQAGLRKNRLLLLWSGNKFKIRKMNFIIQSFYSFTISHFFHS